MGMSVAPAMCPLRISWGSRMSTNTSSRPSARRAATPSPSISTSGSGSSTAAGAGGGAVVGGRLGEGGGEPFFGRMVR